MAAIFPDGIIDFGFDVQFGEMSANRCLAVLLENLTSSVPTSGQACPTADAAACATTRKAEAVAERFRRSYRSHFRAPPPPIHHIPHLSTGDFQEALAALLGKNAPNLSPAVISRLTAEWQTDYDAWQKRDLSARRYVYVWADGVYLQARMEDAAECMLVLIGATPEGKKELVGFQTGVREGAQSWRELLIDIKQRGLEIAPTSRSATARLASGRRSRRSFEHQAPAVLGSQDRQRAEQSRPLGPAQHEGRPSRDLWRADPRGGRAAIDVFADKYDAKYDKAVACLTKDREALLAFFDFPAEHWDHLRTSNPIESVFATVRHRTVRTKGALSAKTAKLMVFKLVNAAAKTWRRLKGENQLPKVVQGVKFQNGIEVIKMSAHHAA